MYVYTHIGVFYRKCGWRKESLGPLKPPISRAIRGNILKGVSRAWHIGPSYYIFINVQKYQEEEWKEDGGRLFSAVPGNWKEAMGTTWNTGYPWAWGNTFSLWEWQSTGYSGSCGVCILGDIKKLPGHDPGLYVALAEQGTWTRWPPA